MKQKLKQVFRLAQDNPPHTHTHTHRGFSPLKKKKTWKLDNQIRNNRVFLVLGLKKKKKKTKKDKSGKHKKTIPLVFFPGNQIPVVLVQETGERGERTHDMFDIHHDRLFDCRDIDLGPLIIKRAEVI